MKYLAKFLDTTTGQTHLIEVSSNNRKVIRDELATRGYTQYSLHKIIPNR